MNGFIYFEAGAQRPAEDLKGLAGLDAGASFHEESFDAGDRLFAWGSASGDIHYCRNGSNTFLILSGYISELKNGPSLANQQQAAKVLLQSLEKDSTNAAVTGLLERLHGSFSVYFHDFRSGLSLCFADRVASRPLWKYWDGKGWIVSSHANAVAFAVPGIKLDPGALGAFLLYAGPMEPRKSLYAGVEAVPSGSIVKLGQAGVVEESRWYRFNHQPTRQLSVRAWLDLAEERLVRSAKRIAAESKRPVVFFSGGVDSRLAAAALQAAGANPLLVTLGDARNIEVRVSQQAAKAMGLEHIVIIRDKHWYLRSLPQCVFETNGSFLWTHGHFASVINNLRAEHKTGVFVLGDFCEAFSKLLCSNEMDQHKLFPPAEFVANMDGMRPPLYRPRDRQRTFSLLNPAIRAEVERSLSEDILKRYESMYGSTKDPRVMADQFARWDSAASISTFFMFFDVRGAGAERNMMFDRDVQELLETMPANIREESNLGAKLVSRFSPRAGRVINSNSLLPIGWPLAAHKFSKKCKPLLGKARRLLLGASHKTTGAWPEKAALYASDPVWGDYIEKILGNAELFPADVFDHNQVRACLRKIRSGNRDYAADTEKLLQLGLLNQLRKVGFSKFTPESVAA